MGAYESMWGVKGDNGGKKRQENLPAITISLADQWFLHSHESQLLRRQGG